MSKSATRITLKHIAAEVGASLSTVSYALSGRTSSARISPERIRVITAAAVRLGYRPNAAARSIKAGSFSTVAVVLSPRWGIDHLPSPLLGGIMAALEPRGLRMLVAHLPATGSGLERLGPALLRELTSDGLLMTFDEQVPDDLERLIDRLRIPTIWLNYQRRHDCVFPDELAVARAATARLIALGHRRLSYAHHAWSHGELAEAHFSVRDRLRGFELALADAGLRPVPGFLRLPAESEAFPQAVAAAVRTLSRRDRPTAVLAYCGEDAEAILAAAHHLGLSVPRDLSLVAFANAPLRLFAIDIDTVLIPFQELGSRGVELLVERIAQPTRRAKPVPVQHRLVPGGSCAPPSGG